MVEVVVTASGKTKSGQAKEVILAAIVNPDGSLISSNGSGGEMPESIKVEAKDATGLAVEVKKSVPLDVKTLPVVKLDPATKVQATLAAGSEVSLKQATPLLVDVGDALQNQKLISGTIFEIGAYRRNVPKSTAWGIEITVPAGKRFKCIHRHVKFTSKEIYLAWRRNCEFSAEAGSTPQPFEGRSMLLPVAGMSTIVSSGQHGILSAKGQYVGGNVHDIGTVGITSEVTGAYAGARELHHIIEAGQTIFMVVDNVDTDNACDVFVSLYFEVLDV